jgi:aminoglycoside phosphotransferase (APT) family kinase protein
LVFRRPPAVSLYSDYDLIRQVMVMNPLRDTPITFAWPVFRRHPEQRATMWWGRVQAIADVHTLDWRSLRLDKLLMPQRGAQPLEQVVAYCAELLRWSSPAGPRQELADAVKWLGDNIYDPEHLVLCWGDSRLSNILYGPQFDVAAVLDWEIAYIGDHEADLAWTLFVD